MSNLKCPFCNSELHKDSDGYYTCYTDNCGCMKYGGNGASGSESLWLALIDTKKKLDIAVDGLKRIEKLTKPSYKNRNLEALALAVNTFSGEIIERINQKEEQ